MEATYEMISAARGFSQGKSDSLWRLFELTIDDIYFQLHFTMADQNEINAELEKFYVSMAKEFFLLENANDIVKWMNQIVVNQLNDWFRTKHMNFLDTERRGMYPIPVYEDKYFPALQASDSEYTSALMNIINELPELFRYTAIAIYYDNYTVEELADMLFEEKSTITKRVEYIEKTLAVKMQEYCMKKKIAKVVINTQKIRTAMIELQKLYRYPYAEALFENIRIKAVH